MAEASGPAASVNDVLQLTGSLINICYDHQRRSNKNVSMNLIESLRSLSDVLHSLYVAVNNEDFNGSSQPSSPPASMLINKEDGTLLLCTTELRALEKFLEAGGGPLNHTELKKTRDNLEGIKVTLDGIMSAIAADVPNPRDIVTDNVDEQYSTLNNVNTWYSVLNNVAGDQYNYYASMQDYVPDKLRWKIHFWLSAPDPSSNHNDSRKKHQPTTGSWFIKDNIFEQWKHKSNLFIWLHGIPGSGKSVLCSTIIEDIRCHCASNPSFAIGYFYCDFSDTQKRQSENIIRSLIIQLSSQHLSCPDSLEALYSQNSDGQEQPTTKSLMVTLRHIIGGFQHVYVIIDALDECQDQDQLLAMIQEIISWKFGSLHLLATSRKERDIEDCVGPLASAQIDLHNAQVNADIQTHLRERLRNDSKLRKWPSKVHDQIEAALMQGAHGMFRWVACQLDALQKCIKLDGLTKALKVLPRSLDETYERILQSIELEHRDDALKVLQWLAFSARPVTLAEVAEALAVDCTNDHPQFDPDQRMRDPQDILGICSSLVTMSSPTFTMNSETETYDHYEGDKSKKELRLAHFSVQEYLTGKRIQNGPTSWCSFNKQVANILISQTCLSYLLQFNRLDSLGPEIHSNFPLALYAAEFWMTHVQSEFDNHAILNVLQKLIICLLRPASAQFFNWVQLYDIDKPWTRSHVELSPMDIPSPLYYASLTGWKTILQHLLDEGMDVNAQGGEYGNTLQVATAKSGSKEIVWLLLNNGADINAQGGHYGNAIQAAAQSGSKEIVQLLLDNGADINAQGGWYGNALQAAARSRSKEIVQLLLNNGTAINAQGGQYGNALQAAAASGSQEIVQLLLNNGADINAQGGWYGNAIQAAVKSGSKQIVQLLLNNGADINAQGGSYGNALQVAVSSGSREIIQLLLNNGADVNAQGGLYGNATQTAAAEALKEIVQLLLNNGANINAQGGVYGNAIQAAAISCSMDIVQLLLDNGADINAQGGWYGNALQAAAISRSKEIVQLLLNNGTDINVQGGHYGNALQAAATSGSQEIVQLLLNNGADINAQNGHYGNALQAAAKSGSKEIFQLLLDNGADINTQGGWYGNALQAAAKSDAKEIVQLLLHNGVDINTQGGWYGNALQAAATSGSKEIVQLLLSNGANINTQAGIYCNALQAAATSHSWEIVQLLLNNGANINAQGGLYGNAIQAAAISCSMDIVQLLLDNGVDINAQGGHYGNALQAAATSGSKNIVQLLLNNGADITIQGGHYGNALQAAARSSSKEIVKLLLNSGTNINVQTCNNIFQPATSDMLLLACGAEINDKSDL